MTSVTYSGPPLESLSECILDVKNPISKRTIAAFHLRTMGTLEAALVIAEALRNKDNGSLMRHELAYIMGQMQHEESSPILEEILATEGEDILVRHESAEALGAIGCSKFLPLLQEYAVHEAPEIAETCQIAIDMIKYKQKLAEEASRSDGEGGTGSSDISKYASIDPAPPVTGVKTLTEYRDTYLDGSLSLFERYRAMFSLRDLNSDESVEVLVQGFQDPSALFRHEVAYVLGQMQRLSSASALITVLKNMDEHRMVRHEAAEALGAIGGEEATKALQEFHDDDEVVVQESCEVALNIVDYWADVSSQDVTSENTSDESGQKLNKKSDA
mmetsp:Transcript_9661/g.18130  ORF Transcript_9661/g.18130 Transcript_9661/m.18130 type:complete len:330 (+) Transcript_9661:75-1064(+)